MPRSRLPAELNELFNVLSPESTSGSSALAKLDARKNRSASRIGVVAHPTRRDAQPLSHFRYGKQPFANVGQGLLHAVAWCLYPIPNTRLANESVVWSLTSCLLSHRFFAARWKVPERNGSIAFAMKFATRHQDLRT